MEDPRYEEKQRKLAELWEQRKADAITDDEGTYVNLTNFRLADHGLTMEDTRVPGNLSLSTTKNRKAGYFLHGGPGGKFRLFKSR